MTEVFAVRIVARKGRQEGNERSWPIGAYLRYRPEVVEGCHGPGGWATYEAASVYEATFGSRTQADAIVEFMRRTYKEIIVEVVCFRLMGVPATPHPDVLGAGWRIVERDRFVLVSFHERPDARTLSKLNRSRFSYRERDRVWFAAVSDEAWAEAKEICDAAETWESVGEFPGDYEDWGDDPRRWGG